MGGRASKRKGSRFELDCVKVLQEHGIAAEKVPLSGAVGGERFGSDISCPVLGIDRQLECKVRAHGFAQVYGYLAQNYGLLLKQDRGEILIVTRLKDWAELAIRADTRRSTQPPIAAGKNPGGVKLAVG